MPFELPATVYKAIFRGDTKDVALRFMQECDEFREEWEAQVVPLISKCEREVIKVGKALLLKYDEEFQQLKPDINDEKARLKSEKASAKAKSDYAKSVREESIIMQQAKKLARDEAIRSERSTIKSEVYSTTSSLPAPIVPISLQTPSRPAPSTIAPKRPNPKIPTLPVTPPIVPISLQTLSMSKHTVMSPPSQVPSRLAPSTVAPKRSPPMRPPSPIVEMPITYEDDISAEDSVSVCQLPTTSPPREKQPPPQPADLRALKPSPPKPIPQEPEFPILVETPIPVEPKPVELPKVEEPKPVEPPKVEEPKPVEPPKVEQDSAIEFTGNDRERPIFDVLVELIEELKLDPTNRPILLHMFARRIYRIKTA
jgi:hypothetical protein